MQVEVPVLIVGGGPVGLLGGVLTAQQGLETLVVERRPSLQRAPAAHVVNARSFEICRAAGVDMQAVAAACEDPEDAAWAIWVTHLGGEEVGRLRFERQGDECLRFTPTPLRNLSQHRFEPILLETLQKTPDAEIRYGHQWESAEQDDAGVTSRIRDVAADAVYEVRSRYLIGADGASSRVRKSLGIELEGPPRIQSFLMIHVEASWRNLVHGSPGVLFWILDPEAGGAFIAHDLDHEWVYMHGFDSDRESEDDYDEARCREIVRRALGGRDAPFEIRQWGTWIMSAQVADRFRDRRIFLAGDSAHRFPPTGGLGLNSGVQDVHGLAWKLAAVEKGWARPKLLDSYESERRPVARNNADQSLRNALELIEIPQALGVIEDPSVERMRATLADPKARAGVEAAIESQAEHFDMLGLQLGFSYEDGAVIPDGTDPPAVENPVRDYAPSSRPGARMPHAWLVQDGERVSSLDLLRRDGFTLLTWQGCDAWDEAMRAATESFPITHVRIGGAVQDPDGHWAEVAGIGAEGALLVRPDQHVAWRARAPGADPVASLEKALRVVRPS